jgi:dinuclear metal center YbgI/SA1388 family protein
MTDRTQLLGFLDGLLQAERFKDYCPNGLQVEGRVSVQRIASAVTASRAVIEAAIAAGADTLLVHHGLFWRGHDGRVTGWLRQRLGLLLAHDINLLAYHLPLDAQPEFGNNAQLGLRLGLRATGHFGDQDLGWIGEPLDGLAFGGPRPLALRVEQVLGRVPTVVEGASRPLRRIAWCTGGAQSYFEAAIAAGADAFLTGEISEPQAHLARESGVSYFACGHHATERYGAPALAAHAAATLGLEHIHLDEDNPA